MLSVTMPGNRMTSTTVPDAEPSYDLPNVPFAQYFKADGSAIHGAYWHDAFGTNQSQGLSGYVRMPLSRNRLYVQESAAWRRTDPFIVAELPFDSIWLHTVAGYSVQRWLRLEGYHSYSRQDTRLAGGQITRHVVGVQFVFSEPMRIR